MSESEPQTSSSSSEEERESSSEENQIQNVFQPYVDEPLADDEWTDGEEEDEVGLAPLTLERRYDGTDPVQIWCSCHQCDSAHLESALEYRCCKEVEPVLSLLCFEGRDDIECITKHPDFEPMTNTTVLKNIAPLLKDTQGRRYRRQPGRSENELLRATAYRWLIRWLCGHLGWGNSRSLPACVYNSIRTRIASHNTTGYATFQERNN